MDTKLLWPRMELRALKNLRKKIFIVPSDVMMPYKDGFTLAKEIREIDDLVPLIFLTAKTLRRRIKGF